MNIQAYIESGILEEYVLGTVSSQEKQEVECMSHIYPEIKEELMRTESALEQYALKHQTPPPASLKETLFAQMNFDEVTEEPESAELTSAEPTLVQADDNIKKLPVENDLIAETQPVSAQEVYADMTTANGGATVIYPSWAKFAVAASILFAILFGWSALQMSGVKKQNEQYAADMDMLKSDMDAMKKEAQYKEALASLYRNPNHKVVRMAGLEKSPESVVAAIWDVKTNDVLLDVQNLPAAPAGKQYQLWTIVDGKPVDMGVLDQEFSNKVLKMKQANPGAVAFAITLEKTGGSPSPTMEDMFVMGKV
ncbi:Anti-sigma-K factor rskA [Dyadobacter koreensis]|uniref:Anti-sigma-K factor rskA n=1 Tax=Dyadobacter koreensis TaxID=408657 RepID=A0A1H7AJV1_9BACT|nr:anti-sigma factor [Dyadobacter koreensis]SEJ64854.1 Anti-sigma-K factor rskA [Dyadobacter koreensis]